MNLNENQLKLENACLKNFKLEDASLSDRYYYDCLPLCLVDSIFSIGVKYKSVEKTVDNFSRKFSLAGFDPNTHIQNDVYSIDDFLSDMKEYSSTDYGASEVYNNHQRTSSRNGILKSEAVYRAALVLKQHNILSLKDIREIGPTSLEKLKSDFMKIPGQKSGISFSYFQMLTGNDNHMKIDRWLIRFYEEATGHKVKAADIQMIYNDLLKTCQKLKERYSNLTPRALDHEIWGKMKANKGLTK